MWRREAFPGVAGASKFLGRPVLKVLAGALRWQTVIWIFFSANLWCPVEEEAAWRPGRRSCCLSAVLQPAAGPRVT